MKLYAIYSIACIGSLLWGIGCAADEYVESYEVIAPEFSERTKAKLNPLRWAHDNFFESHSALVLALSEARGDESIVAQLDFASLYLAYMMIPEVSSIMNSIDQAKVPKDQTLRFHELTDAVSLLQGKAIEDLPSSVLVREERQDRAFWLALGSINTGDSHLLLESLQKAVSDLRLVPIPIRKAVLPAFIEALIEVDDLEKALGALNELKRYSEHQNESVIFFLKGRIAQRSKKQKTAFEYFLAASEKWDKYAARARIELARIALDDGSVDAILAAQGILTEGVNAWRGDQYELEHLKLLAETNSRSNSVFEAIITNGRIKLRFPNTSAAINAEQFTTDGLVSFYQSGSKGELPLSDWIEKHFQLVTIFRHRDDFFRHSETLGDFALALGATEFATSEYSRALRMLLEQLETTRNRPPQDTAVSIQLKIVRALSAGGQYREALIVLTDVPKPKTKIMKDLKVELSADIMTELGDAVDTQAESAHVPSALYLSQLAAAHFDDGSWGKSIVQYSKLRALYPRSFMIDDAIFMLVAAHRNGDLETAEVLIKSFPSLTNSKEFAKFAARLVETPADIFPLTIKRTNQRLIGVDTMLKLLSDSDTWINQ